MNGFNKIGAHGHDVGKRRQGRPRLRWADMLTAGTGIRRYNGQEE